MQAGDDFERLNLGPNWGVRQGKPGIVNSSDLGIVSGAFTLAAWTATVFQADQFCEGLISSNVDARMEKQVFVRRRASDLARYGFHYNLEASRWEIKYDGVPTPEVKILASRDDLPKPNPGDSLRITVIDFAIAGYLNDALVLDANDDSPEQIVAGIPGLAFRPPAGISLTQPAPVFENWSGGDLP